MMMLRALILALGVVTLAGCESPSEPPPAPPPAPDPAPDPAPEPAPAPAPASPFVFRPPGELMEGSFYIAAEGRKNVAGELAYTEVFNHAPGMRFPLESGPAYSNSQIYNPGGYAEFTRPGVTFEPARGSQNVPQNYAYPWVDNYCEVRSPGRTSRPECADVQGVHTGLDIRPATCTHDHVLVAVADGPMRRPNWHYLEMTAGDRVFQYMHIGHYPLVDLPDFGRTVNVTEGEPIGYLSNTGPGTRPDGTPGAVAYSTVHLHFQIKIPTASGWVHAPPYPALVDAYQRLGDADPANHIPAAGPIGSCSGVSPAPGDADWRGD